jgi:hypothetical protein
MLLRNRLIGANSTKLPYDTAPQLNRHARRERCYLVAAASPKGGHRILTANCAAECIAPALLKDQNIPKDVTVELHDYPGALDGRIAASTCAILRRKRQRERGRCIPLGHRRSLTKPIKVKL